MKIQLVFLILHYSTKLDAFRGLIVQNKGLPRFKKEITFINILESVHAEDAKILIAMKDKTLEKMYHGLTEACVRKAFPTLLNQRTS